MARRRTHHQLPTANPTTQPLTANLLPQDPDPDKDVNRTAAEECAVEDGCGPLPDGEPAWEVRQHADGHPSV